MKTVNYLPSQARASRGGIRPFILLALLLVLTASALTAQTRYVDPTGSDAGDCSLPGSPCQTITYAVGQANTGDEVQVAAGTYAENVAINKSLTLTGNSAVVQGSDGPVLGTFMITSGVNDVTIQGFTLIGFDGASAGLEKAALYVQGAHSNLTIQNNTITANGEAGLLSEYGAALNGIVIDGNTFDGQTFVGPEPADCGFGSQFSVLNVPRQLVVIQGYAATGVVFTNNLITGTAGGNTTNPTCAAVGQGNTLVTIDDAGGAIISGNTFSGTTARYASMLRTRGSANSIFNNTFDGTNLIGAAFFHFYDSDALTGGTPDNTLDLLAANSYTPAAGYVESGGNTSIIACIPGPAPTTPAQTVEFCEGAGNLDRLLILPNGVITSDELVVWVLQSAPAAAGLTPGTEYQPNCDGSGYSDATFFLSGTTRRGIRLQPAAPAGDYVFKIKTKDCTTGCASQLSDALFTLSKKDDPTVDITADPTGDICLNTLGVQYNPNLSATDGGTYTFAWCAYNSGDDSGPCYPGFNDETLEQPTRDWTSSAGPKSVGVTVTGSTPGCDASDLYTFMVNPLPDPPTPGVTEKAFCWGADLAPNLGNTGVSVEAIAPDERIVWVLTAKPDNSDYTLGMEFQTTDCSDPFENYGELAVANTSRVIRVNSNAPTNGGGDPIVGSYVLEAYILNCETGCASDPIGTFTITVEGEEAPVLDCSNLNMTFPNTEGLCEGDVTLPVPGATDDCEVVTLEYRYREVDENNDPIGLWSDWANSEDNDLTLPVGIYRVRWRAIDALGQQDACTRFVTVEDVEAPEAICNGFTVVFNGEDDISLDPADLAVVSDNCDVATHTIAPTEVSCEDLGEEIAVVSTVTDIHGLSSTCTSLVTVDGLPCGWMTWDDHVDCPGSSADYDVFSETFYLTSAACSHTPYSPLDEAYANVKTVLCGDGEIIARVSSLDGLGKAWAGITMRENNDPGSKKFQVMTGLDHLQHRVDWRTSTDGFNQTQNFSRFGHQWLRIVRTGPIFQAFTSLDGVIWSQPVNTQVIAMEECLEVGLIVTNVPYASNVTAGFDHVQVTPPYAPNPNRPDVANGQPTDAVYLETFPNPTSGQLTLNLSAFLDQEATLEVLDLNGQLLFQRQLGLVEQSTEQLDLSSYAAGMYFVRVLTNDGTAAVQRVILQPRP